MNYIKYILIITFSTSVISGDYSDQRGMTKLLGTETTLRCAEQMMQPGAKTYELSYERTGTMPNLLLLVNINQNSYLSLGGRVLFIFIPWMF